jgi:hypothetical protein
MVRQSPADAPGQFNFMRRFYMGLPPTSQGALAGSGALLIEHDGDQGGQILWTDDAFPRRPTLMPKAFTAALNQVKTGKLDADGTNYDDLRGACRRRDPGCIDPLRMFSRTQ